MPSNWVPQSRGVVCGQPEEAAKLPVPRREDDVEIIGGDEATDTFAAYFADTSKEADRPAVFDEYLGLAVETPREGLTTEKLWAAV